MKFILLFYIKEKKKKQKKILYLQNMKQSIKKFIQWKKKDKMEFIFMRKSLN